MKNLKIFFIFILFFGTASSSTDELNLEILIKRSDNIFWGELTHKEKNNHDNYSIFHFCKVVQVYGNSNIDSNECVHIKAKLTGEDDISIPKFSKLKRYLIFNNKLNLITVSSSGTHGVLVEHKGRMYNYYGMPIIDVDDNSNIVLGPFGESEKAMSSQNFLNEVMTWSK